MIVGLLLKSQIKYNAIEFPIAMSQGLHLQLFFLLTCK